MHKTDAARPAGTYGPLLNRFLGDTLVDSTSEFSIMPKGVDLASMSARPDLKRAVLFSYLVNHQQRGYQVIVCVGGEGKILMSFFGRRRSWKF